MTCLVQPVFLDATIDLLYTATTQTARLDMVEVRNSDTVARTLTASLVTSGQAPAPVHVRIVTQVAAGATLIVRELIGHDIDAGDSLQAMADSAGVLSIRVSGRLV